MDVFGDSLGSCPDIQLTKNKQGTLTLSWKTPFKTTTIKVFRSGSVNIEQTSISGDGGSIYETASTERVIFKSLDDLIAAAFKLRLLQQPTVPIEP